MLCVTLQWAAHDHTGAPTSSEHPWEQRSSPATGGVGPASHDPYGALRGTRLFLLEHLQWHGSPSARWIARHYVWTCDALLPALTPFVHTAALPGGGADSWSGYSATLNYGGNVSDLWATVRLLTELSTLFPEMACVVRDVTPCLRRDAGADAAGPLGDSCLVEEDADLLLMEAADAEIEASDAQLRHYLRRWGVAEKRGGAGQPVDYPKALRGRVLVHRSGVYVVPPGEGCGGPAAEIPLGGVRASSRALIAHFLRLPEALRARHAEDALTRVIHRKLEQYTALPAVRVDNVHLTPLLLPNRLAAVARDHPRLVLRAIQLLLHELQLEHSGEGGWRPLDTTSPSALAGFEARCSTGSWCHTLPSLAALPPRCFHEDTPYATELRHSAERILHEYHMQLVQEPPLAGAEDALPQSDRRAPACTLVRVPLPRFVFVQLYFLPIPPTSVWQSHLLVAGSTLQRPSSEACGGGRGNPQTQMALHRAAELGVKVAVALLQLQRLQRSGAVLPSHTAAVPSPVPTTPSARCASDVCHESLLSYSVFLEARLDAERRRTSEEAAPWPACGETTVSGHSRDSCWHCGVASDDVSWLHRYAEEAHNENMEDLTAALQRWEVNMNRGIESGSDSGTDDGAEGGESGPTPYTTTQAGGWERETTTHTGDRNGSQLCFRHETRRSAPRRFAAANVMGRGGRRRRWSKADELLGAMDAVLQPAAGSEANLVDGETRASDVFANPLLLQVLRQVGSECDT